MRPYYEHAGITIYLGDCREILPLISGIDTIIADPPYGVKERTNRKTSGRGKTRFNCFVDSRDWKPVIGDDQPFDPSHLLSYKKIVLWGGNHYCQHLPGKPHWLIWDKREKMTPDDNADCELAWTNLKGPARIHRQLWRGICKRGEENVSTGNGIFHPTQKPVSLMRWCISQVGKTDLICDPYLGSGTTLRAAKDLGRKAIGIEIDEHYCEIAAMRLSQEVLQIT